MSSYYYRCNYSVSEYLPDTSSWCPKEQLCQRLKYKTVLAVTLYPDIALYENAHLPCNLSFGVVMMNISCSLLLCMNSIIFIVNQDGQNIFQQSATRF